MRVCVSVYCCSVNTSGRCQIEVLRSTAVFIYHRSGICASPETLLGPPGAATSSLVQWRDLHSYRHVTAQHGPETAQHITSNCLTQSESQHSTASAFFTKIKSQVRCRQRRWHHNLDSTQVSVQKMISQQGGLYIETPVTHTGC